MTDERKSTIGTNQGQKPTPDEPPVSHENEASAGPHDEGGHGGVVININSSEE